MKRPQPTLRADLPTDTIFNIGVSGGKDSDAVLIWMVNESGIPHAQLDVTFCDTGNEHEVTYEHVRYLSETVFPIRTITPEKTFFDLAFHKQRFPSPKVRFCTQLLKIEPTQDHIHSLIVQGKRVVAVSGVRADESDDRANLPEWDFSGHLLCETWRPLINWELAHVLDIHNEYNVPLNPLYEAGAERVGCYPCIMSKKKEIRKAFQHSPERFDRIREAENSFETIHGRFSSFFGPKTVPPRFRSKPCKNKDGSTSLIATIDDVIRWSLTGNRAKGSYLDEPEEPKSCRSGFCE